MANIFINETNDFSAVTPQKVIGYNINPSIGTGTYTALNTVRYQAFTFSEAGNCAGVLVGLRMGSNSAAQSITVTLQQNSGGWSDTSSTKTRTYQSVLGEHYALSTSASLTYVYFPFDTPTAVTTDADTWRIKISSTDTYAAIQNNLTSGYEMAVIEQETTSYSSGDNILVADGGLVISVDQSFTATDFLLGCNSELSWQAPASAYTVNITSLILSHTSAVRVGSSESRIPVAQLATFNVTTWKWGHGFAGWGGQELELYGAAPTNYFTTIASTALAGQKNIETSADMSATWVNGDTVWVLGENGGMEVKTIDSVSGTTVTLTTNLSLKHSAGWNIVNVTRHAAQVGIKGIAFGTSLYPTSCQTFKISGVNATGTVAVYSPYPGVGTETAYLMEDVITTGAPVYFAITGTGFTTTGNTIRRVFQYNTSHTFTISLTTVVDSLIEDCCCGVYAWGMSISAINSTINRCQISKGWGPSSSYSGLGFVLVGCTVNDCKNMSSPLVLSGCINTVFNNCTSDSAVYGVFVNTACYGVRFKDCLFGQETTNSSGTHYAYTVFSDVTYDNCKLDTIPVVGNTIATAVDGSSAKFQTHNQTANDHRVYYKYGQLQSTGDGLSDTTVHTSGTGKFAVKLTPYSGTTLFDDWSFTVPTGNIQNKTMTVAVWVKINNAAYWAGTHQLPRLTIDYDNGTTAYAQATESTDWQQLFVTFTPTTTYGQITVTISGKTDATTTDRDFYVDDMAILYPAGTALDLGGMDNWADALPVSPPLAIPISAYTVSNAVWEEAVSSHTTAGSMGLALGFVKKVIGWLRTLL